MAIFYQICEMAATSVETVIMLEFITKLLGCRYCGIQKIMVLVLSFLVINLYMFSTDYFSESYSALSDAIALLLYLVFAIVFTKQTFLYRVITPILCITAILLINIMVHIMVSNMFHIDSDMLLQERNGLRVVSLFITKFTFFLLTRIILKIVKPNPIQIAAREFVAIFAAFFISVIMVLFTAELQYHNNEPKVRNLTIIIFLGMIIINVTIFRLLSILAKKNQEALHYAIMETKYEEQKKMQDSIQVVYHNLQILQHDLKNELLCIQNYIEQDQNAEAIRYISEITKMKTTKFHEYIETGNDLIDMMLNVKLNFAREQGIEIRTNICTNFTGFEAHDIVNLFANAMDNAIEASVRQKKKYIVLSMENKRNYLCIVIGNAMDFSVLRNNGALHTTKSDKRRHGFGTQSMKNIVEKYDGAMEYYEKNGMFFLDIMMRSD